MALIDSSIYQNAPGSFLRAGITGYDRGQQANDQAAQRQDQQRQRQQQQQQAQAQAAQQQTQWQQQNQAEQRKQIFNARLSHYIGKYGERGSTPEGQREMFRDMAKEGFGNEMATILGGIPMQEKIAQPPVVAPPSAYQVGKDEWDHKFKERQQRAIEEKNARDIALAANKVEADNNKPTVLNEAQSKTIGAAGTAKAMLDDIATQFSGSGLGGAKGYAADVVESIPLVGGKLAPKTNAYNDKRRITAETFLREATGAAAPASEVEFYTNLLPEPGDNEEQAQSALNAFRGAVIAKTKGVSSTLRAQGRAKQADEIDSKVKDLFSSSVDIKTPKKVMPGDIDSGYKFKGGDPANPANWVKWGAK